MTRNMGLAGWILLCLLGLNASVGQPAKEEAVEIEGFSLARLQLQKKIERQYQALTSAESCRKFLRRLTEKPHIAGTKENFDLALYVRDQFREFGLEEVEMIEYPVLLSYPREISVQMVEPESYEAKLREEPLVPEENPEDHVSVGFNAYSASGEVTAELVYAHGGNPEDYDKLLEHGIDIRGKIALVRYSLPYSYRGFKALTAQERGAAALLIYSDPKEDGHLKGAVYPKGPWGPDNHLQRGSIAFDFMVPGDPLTPGWVSVEGGRRLERDESEILPKIISVPLSARDARPLLENLGGPEAPPEWQGGLPLTYRLGPGPTKVRVSVDMEDPVRSIWNVVGLIRGEEEPDRWVIIGNHRDAWVYGAVDPSSGTASLLEVARSMGELLKEGYRPRRSILFCNWDAEEYTLTGSTEWVEQWAEDLAEKGVAYINVDSAASGPDLNVTAMPSLRNFIPSITKVIPDPNTGASLFEAWKKVEASSREKDPAVPLKLTDTRVGSGSDHTAFLNFVGVPVINMTFDGPYGVYHSRYDNFYWMSQFGDPTFGYHEAMARIMGLAILRLANADLLPFDYEDYAVEIATYVSETRAEIPGSLAAEVRTLLSKLKAFEEAGRQMNRRVSALLSAENPPSPEQREPVNNALMQVERALCSPEGIPYRPWYKHLIYACKYNYDPEVLPGVTAAVERKNWNLTREQLGLLTGAIEKATLVLTEVNQP